MTEEYKRQVAELCAENIRLDSENSRLLKTVAKLNNERDQYKRERDTLINDIAVVRGRRDKNKRALDEVVKLFERHLRFKMSVTNSPFYVRLKHKLNQILKENEYEQTN